MTTPVAAAGSGRGKVILVGEHAAVYGHPALAGALGCGVSLRALPTRGQVPVDNAAAGAAALSTGTCPRVGLKVAGAGWDFAVRSDEDHALARAITAVAAALGVARAELEGEADVPPGAGLGSSAALAVALVRTLAGTTGTVLDDAAVEAIADRAERCFHGNPSGIDVAIAARGGMGLFRRGHGLATVAAQPLPLVIGLSGQPRSTADMVAKVAAARAERPVVIDAELAALGAAAERAAVIVGTGERGLEACARELGAIFDDAHRRLAGLGVSTPVLDAMVAAARGAGASGAKLTGGGGGGAVIALAPGREQAVLAAWRALGKDGFVTRVGVATS